MMIVKLDRDIRIDVIQYYVVRFVICDACFICVRLSKVRAIKRTLHLFHLNGNPLPADAFLISRMQMRRTEFQIKKKN